MNKDGLGVPKNLEEAHKHFTIAAAKGNSEAVEELKHFKKGLLGGNSSNTEYTRRR